MAHLPHVAKSGSRWTRAELDAYNITIRDEDAPTFFGLPAMPEPAVDEEGLQGEHARLMVNPENARLLAHLNHAMIPSSSNSKSSTIAFTIALFEVLDYMGYHYVARSRWDIPFLICGQWKQSRTDVCIYNHSQNTIMLLVREDKRFITGAETEATAELIASAIAAFSYNNEARRTAGLPAYESRIIPGILMAGTSPTFYKIPVTAELENAVHGGLYPSFATQVSKHEPVVPRPNFRLREGMKPIDARREIFKFYEAFKAVLDV